MIAVLLAAWLSLAPDSPSRRGVSSPPKMVVSTDTKTTSQKQSTPLRETKSDSSAIDDSTSIETVDEPAFDYLPPREAIPRLRACVQHEADRRELSRSQIEATANPNPLAEQRSRAARQVLDGLCAEADQLSPEAKQSAIARATQRATTSTDPADRLLGLAFNYEPLTDASAELSRQIYTAAITSGDPELLAWIGGSLNTREGSTVERLGPYAASDLSFPSFTLAGCDLGADCSPNSIWFQFNCAQDAAACLFDDLEAQLLSSSYPPRAHPYIQRERRNIVRRIRSGQAALLFTPVPPPKT